jgi:hypothetical protein
VPPPESFSMEPRMVDRFVPVPEPHLKSMPSVLASVRMDSMESWMELIKHAEHCGVLVAGRTEFDLRPSCGFQCQLAASEFGSMRSQPTLNHTGELNAAYWCSRMCASSS